MSEARELVEWLRGEVEYHVETGEVVYGHNELAAADLIERQSKIIEEIDGAWIQFVNCWGDPTGDEAYDKAETKQNVTRMDDCLRRASTLKGRD